MLKFVFMFSIQKIYLTKNQQSLTKQAIFQQQGSLQYYSVLENSLLFWIPSLSSSLKIVWLLREVNQTLLIDVYGLEQPLCLQGFCSDVRE